MQALGHTSTLGNVYTDAQVAARLILNTGAERWLFDRLDASFNYLSDLTPFVSYTQPPKITHDATAAVKRKIKLTIRGDAPLNPLSDLIRVHYQLMMAPNDFLDWALGTFVMLPPAKTISKGLTWGTIDGTDLSQLLVDGAFANSFSVMSGQTVVGGVKAIVQSLGGKTPIQVQIPDSGQTFPASFALAQPGETRLQAINKCLQAINYYDAWFDELGVMRSSPIPDYTTITPSFTFDTTLNAEQVKTPITQSIDMSNAYNQVLLLIEDPRRTPIYVLYQNIRPDSPVSIPNWHPKLKLIRDSSIVDVASAYARAQTYAQQAARVYSKILINTWPWPLSQNYDVYQLIYSTAEEGLSSFPYLEEKWEHECKTGGNTSHTFSRIVAA